MPRSNRPRRRPGTGAGAGRAGRHRGTEPASGVGPGGPGELDRLLGLDPGYRHETGPDGGWHVRRIPAWRAVKDYTCPGCGRTIPPGLAHLVAWRSDSILGDEAAGAERRHWHPKCWSTRRQDGRY
ncbi:MULTISPECIES: hypothetical protein [Micrococcaceae]|uniref:hypothetical protein n=1 Tax=Micrococcaceae TaxID=1268 RepID=UPI0016211FCD|nr:MULTISPECIES: hypothetical protein [Micrococcaceae]MBB5748377.1 hypothetical protein [Micrococcus sp. TA1]HRO29534.1 hypothetical protein [Citricoccus sp.]HRO93512.1 hypothetical protein [Citricoccus sp.]